MLVCLLIELNIQLTGGPANSGAVQVWAGGAENQKSEAALSSSGPTNKSEFTVVVWATDGFTVRPEGHSARFRLEH